MRINKRNLNFLINNYLKESRDDELSDFDKAASSHIDRYGEAPSKMQQAYKDSKETIYLDDFKNIPNAPNQNLDNVPTLEDFYEEHIALATLVRQNLRNLNGVYPKLAQDKYDIKRILKKLNMEEDPIF